MKVKRLTCFIVSLVLAGTTLAVSACGGSNSTNSGGGSGKQTEIIIEVDSGGITAGLDRLTESFRAGGNRLTVRTVGSGLR